VRALELRDSDRQLIRELEELSNKAGNGDREARLELRRALRRSSPGVVARCSDLAGNYRRILARTASAGDALLQGALEERMERMREEVAGESPSPLEILLAERVVSCWMLVELLEALNSGYYVRDLPEGGKRVDVRYFMQMVKILDRAYSRYLASIQTLARVRKLQANTPGIQVNTQINLR
jgi:hypothetical protein